MSTDYDVVCDLCKRRRHLGQRFTGSLGVVFGYGSDDAEGRKKVGVFISEHMACQSGGLRIVTDAPLDYLCEDDLDRGDSKRAEG